VLEVFDLRENALSVLEDVARLVDDAPALMSLGLAGNALPKEYRALLLTRLRRLHFQRSPLRLLDEQEITPAEIFAAAQAVSGIGKESNVNLAQMRFSVAFACRAPPKSHSTDVLTELNLGSCGLEMLDLSSLRSLHKLSLADNALTCKYLSAPALGLASLTALTYLDLARNKVRSPELVAASALAPLTLLAHLDLSGNPGTLNLGRVELGRLFPSLAEPSCQLRSLNGTFLSLDEHCEIATLLGVAATELDTWRLACCLHARGARAEACSSLDLSGCGLRKLGQLESFSRLVSLDLSSNVLLFLSDSLFAMGALRYLDLRDNGMNISLAELLAGLDQCTSLSALFLLRALACGTAKLTQYFSKVLMALPSLQRLDGRKRPALLDEHVARVPPKQVNVCLLFFLFVRFECLKRDCLLRDPSRDTLMVFWVASCRLKHGGPVH
jgi:Leucine-rich repeat (LRR) protein